ncbi:MAG: bL17 family ribosomal protein [Planctomycetaceae bacterium]
MRHRRLGRVLGRSPSHRKAMFKNMVAALFLTERDASDEPNAPKVKGRIVTTLPKAKELRPFVERSITLAKKILVINEQAAPFATDAKRNSEAWKQWRQGEGWKKWAAAMAPAVAARRRLVQMVGDKQAVGILVNDIAPRFKDRAGGYTRVLKLAKPRLGDAGQRAILELVGIRDRKVAKSQKPSFGDEAAS